MDATGDCSSSITSRYKVGRLGNECMMKEQATRHLAVTQDGAIIGVISVSNILRYYSGVI